MDQRLQKSNSEQQYELKRINEDPITISKKAYDQIVLALNQGKTHVQLGEYFIMLSTVTSINPLQQKLNYDFYKDDSPEPLSDEARKRSLEKLQEIKNNFKLKSMD